MAALVEDSYLGPLSIPSTARGHKTDTSETNARILATHLRWFEIRPICRTIYVAGDACNAPKPPW